jgi:hypothetical protein
MSPNFPESYETNQRCDITVAADSTAIEVVDFNVEGGFDTMNFNDEKYSSGHNIHGIVPDVRGIVWTSDHSVTDSGWKICPRAADGATRAPPVAPAVPAADSSGCRDIAGFYNYTAGTVLCASPAQCTVTITATSTACTFDATTTIGSWSGSKQITVDGDALTWVEDTCYKAVISEGKVRWNNYGEWTLNDPTTEQKQPGSATAAQASFGVGISGDDVAEETCDDLSGIYRDVSTWGEIEVQQTGCDGVAYPYFISGWSDPYRIKVVGSDLYFPGKACYGTSTSSSITWCSGSVWDSKRALPATSDYVQQQFGCCAVPITTSSECASAASALGLDDTTVSDDGQNGVNYDPPNCYAEGRSRRRTGRRRSLRYLKLNSGGTNTGECGDWDQCLCKEDIDTTLLTCTYIDGRFDVSGYSHSDGSTISKGAITIRQWQDWTNDGACKGGAQWVDQNSGDWTGEWWLRMAGDWAWFTYLPWKKGKINKDADTGAITINWNTCEVWTLQTGAITTG